MMMNLDHDSIPPKINQSLSTILLYVGSIIVGSESKRILFERFLIGNLLRQFGQFRRVEAVTIAMGQETLLEEYFIFAVRRG